MKWFGLFAAGMLLAAPAVARDCNNATTQVDMNMCANEGYERVDAALNEIYGQLRRNMQKTNPDSVPLLVDAQRAWITFRDKHCAFVSSGYEGGSMQSFVITSCRTELTEYRNEELGRQIEGDQD